MIKTMFIITTVLIIIYLGYHTYRFSKLEKGLDSKIAKGAVILDVRTASEYEKDILKVP